MTIRWFSSKTVREACALRKHVRRWLSAQRDLLSPMAVGAVTAAMNEVQKAIVEGANTGKIRIKAEELEFAANKWLKPYPHAMWRENVEVLLVAIAVAMGIRTFFLQPFKIPTGSMQPTLYGVQSMPDCSRLTLQVNGGLEDKSKIQAGFDQQLKLSNDLAIPGGLERFKEWFRGISYVHVVAQNDGPLTGISPMRRFLIFNIKQTIWIGGMAHTMWFPPDFGEEPMEYRSGLVLKHLINPERVYHQGDELVKLRVNAGDHLFVDRLTYNFRKPRRGEIVVFETKGIPEERRDYFRIPPNEFYIKRLVGLGGDTLSLARDYEVSGVPQPDGSTANELVGHLVVNGQPLSASTPHFENLYSFADAPAHTNVLVYHENHYYGHAMLPKAQYLTSPGSEFHIRPDSYCVMGDNTMNSLDSRYWGDFPATCVIGKSFFVYWPITSRFGWGNQ
ncbi:MAG: S26 family signal peptidase [Verrucomicrobiota bacterium]|jgi:signal peptidase I